MEKSDIIQKIEDIKAKIVNADKETKKRYKKLLKQWELLLMKKG